jgi:hypothetical protein
MGEIRSENQRRAPSKSVYESRPLASGGLAEKAKKL